jgi:hypothetical protein
MALPQERLRATERSMAMALGPGLRVSWAGVWSGFLIALGIMMLLATLGLAIGVTAAGAGSRGLGIGAGIWGELTLLVAMFLGGAVAARLGPAFEGVTSALHGALVWVLGTLAVLYFAASGVSLGLNALLGVVGGVGQVAGAAATGSGGLLGDLASGDVNQILARLDDPGTAATVAAATGMSNDEAARSLADLRRRIDAARSDPNRALAEAREGVRQLASRAASQAGAAAQATSWMAFATLVLSLLAAVGGALWGGRRGGPGYATG